MSTSKSTRRWSSAQESIYTYITLVYSSSKAKYFSSNKKSYNLKMGVAPEYRAHEACIEVAIQNITVYKWVWHIRIGIVLPCTF